LNATSFGFSLSLSLSLKCKIFAFDWIRTGRWHRSPTPAARHRSKCGGGGVNWAGLCTTPAFPPAQRNVDKQNILVKAVKIQNILDLRGVGA
jgi:hypothetical protein